MDIIPNRLKEDFEAYYGDQLLPSSPFVRWIAYAEWLEKKLSEEAIDAALKQQYYEHNGKVYRNDKKDILGFREFARVIRQADLYKNNEMNI